MLKDSITTTYKKVNKKIVKQINLEGKNIVKDKTIANRILVNGHDECFISLKDHKPNFTNNPKTRLINPAKNEIGRLSKSILDKINNKLRNTTRLNQWKDTSEVINWFNKIEEKSKHTFIVFEIKDFYPSISKYLLQKALEFAKAKVSLAQDEEKIIYHSPKSLLFKDQETWIKKRGRAG